MRCSNIYNNKMMRISNQFTEVASRMRQREDYSQIFQQQSSKFDLATYKIDHITCQGMIRLYESILKKYTVTNELQVDQNAWHQNERRLFVWFIICFTYFNPNHLSYQLASDDAFWNDLSPTFFNKKPELLQFQYLNMIRTRKRESWTQRDDQCLLEALREESEGRWNQISKRMYYSSQKKCFKAPKQCRQRWLNHLDTTKKRGAWSSAQDLTIFKYILEHGKHWSKIVPLLNHTRTQHMIKNRYNSLVSKFVSTNNTTATEAIESLCNTLSKQMLEQSECSSFEKKSSLKKSDAAMTSQDEKSEEDAVILTPQPLLEEVKVYEDVPLPIYYTYYMDFNANVYVNPFFSQQPYLESYYSFQTSGPSLKQSPKSSFSLYESNRFV